MIDANGPSSLQGKPPTDVATFATAVQERFDGSDYASLRGVRCVAEKNAVVLLGSVSSYYLKQVAQEVCRRASGPCPVINSLTVVPDGEQVAVADVSAEHTIR